MIVLHSVKGSILIILLELTVFMKSYDTHLPSVMAGGVVPDCDGGTVSLCSSIKYQQYSIVRTMYVTLGMKWFASRVDQACHDESGYCIYTKAYTRQRLSQGQSILEASIQLNTSQQSEGLRLNKITYKLVSHGMARYNTLL